MAMEGEFTRSASERGHGLPHSYKDKGDPYAAETMRQRAIQAAEYYHRSLGSLNTSTSSDGSSHGDKHYSRVNENYKVNGSMHGKGHATPQSEHFYRSKRRPGELDHRNSYNEKLLSTYGQGLSLMSNAPTRHRNREHDGNRVSYHGDAGKPLYRSNSSLDIDHVDYINDSQAFLTRRNHYGSANSLDTLDTPDPAANESFFEMLKDFKTENLDQRAPAPPQMQEVLRGKLDLSAENPPPSRSSSAATSLASMNTSSSAGIVANGSIPVEPVPEPERPISPPGSRAKTPKTKDRNKRVKSMSGDGAGLFRKLRGTKSDATDTLSKTSDNSSESEFKLDEIIRRKALTHYDCQSISVNLSDVIHRRNSIRKRRNTTTGASAASANRTVPRGDNEGSEDSDSDESDVGDGKTNDLLLSCAYFRNELGGEEERTISLTQGTAQRRVQQLLGHKGADAQTMMRRPACSGVAILDTSVGTNGEKEPAIIMHNGHVIEHLDRGAFYYRNFFFNQDHQNYFGQDENIGPVAISIRREKVDDKDGNKNEGSPLYQNRVIVRSSELTTLRGTILEDAIPSSSKLSNSRGLPVKDVLEYVCPDIQLSCLRLATPGQKTSEQLMKLDEQGIARTYKIGIMYCKAGQSSEEEMYNNEHAGPAFQEFLDLIGHKVRLKGFEKYRAGLDNKTDSTGTHSLFATFNNNEIMFHVSTMLPYTPNNRQQLLRKRHIGNDIVTVVFQEPGAAPFTPKTVRSHFQHVFILVRAYNINTDNVKYRIAVTRSKDVPAFGPPIPDGAMFSKSKEFADFLLAKVINAENAAHKSEKFLAMATRTRQEYLKDLATNFVTTTPLDTGSKLSKFALGSGRKKERSKQKVVPDICAKGAVIWNVQVEDFGQHVNINCYLGIAMETIVIIEEVSKEVVLTIPGRSVIGWTSQTNSLRIFYDHGECIHVIAHNVNSEIDEIQEIVSRLAVVSQGCETVEMTLRRNGLGQLGFHVHYEGIVSDVEPYGFAWQAGLRQGSRLVEICKVATATLTHEQMVDLLRTSVTVKVVVIPPFEDGMPRRGVEDHHSSQSSLNSQHTFSSAEHGHIDDEFVLPPSVRSSMRSQGSKQSSRGESKNSTPSRGSAVVPPSYGDIKSATQNLDARFSQPVGQAKLWSSKADHLNHGSREQISGSHGSDGWYDPRSTDPMDVMATHLHGNSNSYLGNDAVKTGNTTMYNSGHSDNRGGTPQEGYTSRTMGTTQHISKSSPQGNNEHRISAISGSNPSINSSSNLSQISDMSSLSSNSSMHGGRNNQQGASTRSPMGTMTYDSHRDQGKVSQQVPNLRKSAFRKPYLDPSPQSSSSSSPKSNRISGHSSDDSIPNRLRPGISTQQTSVQHSGKGTPVPLKALGPMTFQEELMRLIDPDVSEAEIRQTKTKSSPGRRGQRLQRTLSDESLVGGGTTKPKSSMPLDGLGHDVIFTTAVPAQVVNTRRDELTKEQRLSPRATVSTPTNLQKRDGRMSSSPILPLPDPASGIDWSNLVDAATKAFEEHGLDQDKPEGASGLTELPEMPDLHGNSGARGKTDLTKHAKYSSSAHDRLGLAGSSRHSNTATPSTWRSSPSSGSAQRIQELEHRCVQLQAELDKERREKRALESEIERLSVENQRLQETAQERRDKESLEMEVLQLRQDNLRLQEESQTAAAQLRKFTEWFFNTIDRQ